MTQGDDSSDDPQLESLRAVWLSMPDEEPPARGLDALMVAARAQATVFASPPWWKRALHALSRPPVLALATVTILIGGAVLISNRDVVKDAGPTVTSPPAATPAIVPPAPEQPKPDLAPPKKLEVKSSDLHGSEHRFEGSTSTGTSKTKPPPHEPRLSGRSSDPSYAPEGERSKVDGLAKTPAATEAETDDKSADETEATSQTRGPAPKQVIVDQLLVQCRSAATRGDCEEAKLIARRIAAQSTAFYNEHVTTDASIQKCITPPVNTLPAQTRD